MADRTVKVAFLDADHVVKLGRYLLAWNNEEARAYGRDFFMPEIVEDADLSAVGTALRDGHLLEIADFGDEEGLRQAEILVFRRGKIDASMIQSMPRLRFIQRIGQSSDPVDLEAARARGILVSCLPRPTLVHVCEHVMLLMLALSRRLLDCDRAVRSGGRAGTPGVDSYNWPGLGGLSLLAGKTLGIAGFGEIGQLLAQRALGFGMRLIVSDRSVLEPSQLSFGSVQQVPLDTLLRQSDFVSVHVPPLPDGRPLIGAAELAIMKPAAMLINTARGVLVDEDALYAALVNRRIAGAALDVHIQEPRGAGDRFLTLPNVVLTPHLAGGSRLGVLDELSSIFENIGDVADGGLPRHARVL